MNDREQQRMIRYRLAVLRQAGEVSVNVAATCCYCGISRILFCRWRNRFDELGEDGLRDRSSRPHRSPAATKGEVIERIVGLRQNCRLGPARIAMCLKRSATTSRSHRRACGGCCIAWAWAGCRRTSAASAAPSGGSVTRPSAPAIACRST
jgi:methyl coenzyme M reductase subunit C